MHIALGSDHVGFDLKQLVKGWLAEDGIDVLDVGPQSLDPTDDYPDFARRVAESVARGEADLGIVVCSTGQGSCIAANKVNGVRAALCNELFCARMSKLHNDANVLCLGSSIVGALLAREIVATWIATSFTGEDRHCRRLEKIARIESDREAPKQ